MTDQVNERVKEIVRKRSKTTKKSAVAIRCKNSIANNFIIWQIQV